MDDIDGFIVTIRGQGCGMPDFTPYLSQISLPGVEKQQASTSARVRSFLKLTQLHHTYVFTVSLLLMYVLSFVDITCEPLKKPCLSLLVRPDTSIPTELESRMPYLGCGGFRKLSTRTE
jgi:hypothetical protein